MSEWEVKSYFEFNINRPGQNDANLNKLAGGYTTLIVVDRV